MSSTNVEVTGPATLVEQKAAVEREIDAFDEFFTRSPSVGGAGNQDPLLPMEKALLRTYLLARLTGLMSSRPAGT